MNSEKRSAIVTGGASGIGASVAKRLELAGVHVRRVDITPTPSSHVLDVTDEQACRQALSDPVDILVNCAGVAGLIMGVRYLRSMSTPG